MSLLSEFQFSQLENESLKETITKQKKEISELKKLISIFSSPKFYLEAKNGEELYKGMRFYYIYNNLGVMLECFLSETDEKAEIIFDNFTNSYIPYREELIKSHREDGIHMIFLKTYTTKISNLTDLPYIHVTYILKNSIESIKEYISENSHSNKSDNVKNSIERILNDWDITFSELKLKKNELNSNNHNTIKLK